ncbi:peptidylprolyl isomerase [Sporosarcina aquimarina]|uniref:LptM family lipoprotein n=1 Tax=Sporosarcina aquimarina TaxID=114975 RepID=UPI00203D2879|nr:peptidylprolyl isomerase [Sporosarcina aquimarina]MCM3757613.1 peptidylprolyl isomerase [Sporosarcina aquimarina]
MKRLFLIMFSAIAILSLSACAQKKLSFEEVDTVPKKVTEAINPDDRLQMINKNGKVSYIVFQSHEDVKSSLESVNKTALIKLDEVDASDNELKQYIYTLTIDESHDTIDIKVNGESTPYPMTIID